MFANLRLTTARTIIGAVLLLLAALFAGTSAYLSSEIRSIERTWTLFQYDRSEKARLESYLRGSLGYGGMIHEFKNYLLRHEDFRKNAVDAHIGAAKTIIKQYRALGVNTAEEIAIEDISKTLLAYQNALLKIDHLIAAGKDIQEIDQLVKINDQSGLRGLNTLRHEFLSVETDDAEHHKSRFISEIRASIGYGGMIHDFKNYILRNDSKYYEACLLGLSAAGKAIAAYRQGDQLSAGERIALEDIEETLKKYKTKLILAKKMISASKTISEIDQAVKIDDQPALRGLKVLNREVAFHVEKLSVAVTQTILTVKEALVWTTWVFIGTLLAIVCFLFWLFQQHVVLPIFQITEMMSQLEGHHFDLSTDRAQQSNEIGEMSRSVLVFRDAMKDQIESESELANANQELSESLADIQKLRIRAEEQTSKALSLAEGMEGARQTAEAARKQAEADEKLIQSVLGAVTDGVITVDVSGYIETFNPGAEGMFGYYAHEAKGKHFSLLIPEEQKDGSGGYFQHFNSDQASREPTVLLQLQAKRRSGEFFPVELTLNRFALSNDIKITGVVRDITERLQWENEIKRLALTDPLTGLANRNQFQSKIKEALELSERLSYHVALLMIDLDKFKPVNDTYGHPAGDELLVKVSERLRNLSREVDTVARLGGDEFAVLLNGVNTIDDVAIPAERIIAELSKPFDIEGHQIQIGASIGVSCNIDKQNIESLTKEADEALYEAKEGGRNTFRLHSRVIDLPNSSGDSSL